MFLFSFSARHKPKKPLVIQFSRYTGWPRKNGTGYFSQYVDAITVLVSVYEVTSPEKNDTKISNFGSVVCFLGHIFWGKGGKLPPPPTPQGPKKKSSRLQTKLVGDWTSLRPSAPQGQNVHTPLIQSKLHIGFYVIFSPRYFLSKWRKVSLTSCYSNTAQNKFHAWKNMFLFEEKKTHINVTTLIHFSMYPVAETWRFVEERAGNEAEIDNHHCKLIGRGKLRTTHDAPLLVMSSIVARS